jgi:Ca2+-binding EF-hand superfamily protein
MNLSRIIFVALFAAAASAAAQDPSPTDKATPRSASPIADGHSDFNHLDVDRDGWLSQSELDADPKNDWDFAAIDRDADGKISSDEWARRNGDAPYDD